ncbi:MAG: ABC transporter permease subunit [Nonomuraea sp.]|nr:ABC transporter permease subunit [Nonomuraea sp.]
MFGRSLRDYRRPLIGWTVGISAFVAMYLAIYASIKQAPDFYGAAALAKFPGPLRELMGGLQDLTSGTGYLQTVVYQLLVPAFCVACTTIMANKAIAQPEEAGTLELVVTLPIDRKRLVVDRFAALVVGVLIMASVTLLVAFTVERAAGADVPFDRLLAGHTGVILLSLFFGCVALAVGAATGKKNLASSVVGVWAVLSYMVITIGQNVPAISWLKWVSPFHYYADGRPLYEGFPVGDYLVLAGATAVLVLGAVLAFDRRDVGV